MLLKEDAPTNEDHHSIHTKVIFITSWGIVVCCIGWMALAYYLGEPLIALLTAPALLGTIFATIVTAYGMPLLGRSVWSAGGIVAVTLASFTIHEAANPELMYLILLGGPFLTFAVGRENLQLIIVTSATAISLVAVLLLGNDFFGTPWVGEAIAEKYVANGMLVMVFILIAVEMAAFGILAHTNQVKMEASNTQARLASRAKTDFLAAMSHEIRTPMNGVVGMVEILESSKLTTEQSRIVETIRDSSTALLSIIEDILDMSRIEAGKLELKLQKTELLSVFEKSADTLRHFAEAHHVTLSINYDPDLPEYLSCDPGRLRQITLNLLSNAIKFSKRPPEDPKGQVLLTVGYNDQGNLKVEVSDDGIGISEDFLSSLFDPFEQSAEVRRHEFGGSGLGLAIVSQLVEKLNGSIGVESQRGQGSTFTVHLPILDQEGQIRLPNLADKTIAYLQNSDGGMHYFQKLIERSGGHFMTFETQEDLITAAQIQNDNVVYIVPYAFENWQNDTATDGSNTWNFSDNTNVIFLSSAHHQLANHSQQEHIVLPSAPILNSALINALERAFNIKAPAPDIGQSNETALLSDKKDSDAPRILAAEDNGINRVVLESQLAQLGYAPIIVEDGAKAYEAWKLGEFDLILTDCQMPIVDGFELTRKIREDEAKDGLNSIPIIAITANAVRGEGERCVAAGMDAYLTKPTTLAELKSTLGKHVKNAGVTSTG
ncbi:ATP-binding protein [Planktotalea sp.]|uniref:ATP-binding protein n=1 Tax=Planktotalea sp. TaxID=2029877 RepID=UPI003F6A9EBF